MTVTGKDKTVAIQSASSSKQSLEDLIVAGFVEVVEARSRKLDSGLLLPSLELKAVRQRLGLSQQDFAERYGVPLSALRNWEQGRRKPDTVANLLLHLIDDEPDLIANAILRLRNTR
jgi:putative transcriptional regulator